MQRCHEHSTACAPPARSSHAELQGQAVHQSGGDGIVLTGAHQSPEEGAPAAAKQYLDNRVSSCCCRSGLSHAFEARCSVNCALENEVRAKPRGGLGFRVAYVRRRGSVSPAEFVLAAVMCAGVVSGFVSVSRPGISPLGSVRRRPAALSARCHMSVKNAQSQGPDADASRTLVKAHATSCEDAVDKLVESTRHLGINPVPLPRAQASQADDTGHEFVGVWASWLSDNCPPCLTSTLAGLTDERASQRKAAVTRLLRGLPSSDGNAVGGSWAFAALAARLGDNSAAVREAAVKGLGHISEKGNRNVVLAMASLIEEETAITVRTAALQALTRVAQRGDQEALAPLLNLLRRVEGTERGDFFSPNLSSNMNRHVVKALSRIADPGNEGAIKALLLRIMDDPNPAVREAAIKGLAGIASPVSPTMPQILWALSMKCEDEDEGVRKSAARHLRLLLKRREAKLILGRPACLPPVALPRALEEDADASVYWLLPNVWEA